MNESWMKSGESGTAHLVKLRGAFGYTTACGVVLNGEHAIKVVLQRVGLAGVPGQYIMKPAEDQVCLTCEKRAREQA